MIVQFDADIADEVLERQWHPTQESKQLKDGRVEISFETKGDIEIKRWVLAFGRYAKVKSPKWLKDEITDEVRAMLAELAKKPNTEFDEQCFEHDDSSFYTKRLNQPGLLRWRSSAPDIRGQRSEVSGFKQRRISGSPGLHRDLKPTARQDR